MCTAATYCTRDFYFGRTLDYEISYGEEITTAMSSDELRFLQNFFRIKQRPPLPQRERGPCLISFS